MLCCLALQLHTAHLGAATHRTRTIIMGAALGSLLLSDEEYEARLAELNDKLKRRAQTQGKPPQQLSFVPRVDCQDPRTALAHEAASGSPFAHLAHGVEAAGDYMASCGYDAGTAQSSFDPLAAPPAPQLAWPPAPPMPVAVAPPRRARKPAAKKPAKKPRAKPAAKPRAKPAAKPRAKKPAAKSKAGRKSPTTVMAVDEVMAADAEQPRKRPRRGKTKDGYAAAMAMMGGDDSDVAMDGDDSSDSDDMSD